MSVEYRPGRPQRPPSHPGEALLEIIEDHAQLSIADAAERMHVTRQALNAVVRGRSRVTAELAERFVAVFGGDASLWLGMQLRCDQYAARVKLAPVLPKLAKFTYPKVA